MRGKRNESAFAHMVLQTLSASYGVAVEAVAQTTNENVARVFGVSPIAGADR